MFINSVPYQSERIQILDIKTTALCNCQFLLYADLIIIRPNGSHLVVAYPPYIYIYIYI